jgi:hypothetical protein
MLPNSPADMLPILSGHFTGGRSQSLLEERIQVLSRLLLLVSFDQRLEVCFGVRISSARNLLRHECLERFGKGKRHRASANKYTLIFTWASASSYQMYSFASARRL